MTAVDRRCLFQLRVVNTGGVGYIDLFRHRRKVLRDLCDDLVEHRVASRLASQRRMRFPSYDDVRLRHLPDEIARDGFGRRKKAAGIDYTGRILAPQAVGIRWNERLYDRFDFLLNGIAQIAVIPHAAKPAARDKDSLDLG